MSNPRRNARTVASIALVSMCLSLALGCQGVRPDTPPSTHSCGENPADFEPDPDVLCDPEGDACSPGMACLLTGCVPSSCFCDPSTGIWACTADCRMWPECLADCNSNGVPDREEDGGACELPDDCLDTPADCCDDLGGDYQGEGTVCSREMSS